jgi:hypothetical protein
MMLSFASISRGRVKIWFVGPGIKPHRMKANILFTQSDYMI